MDDNGYAGKLAGGFGARAVNEPDFLSIRNQLSTVPHPSNHLRTRRLTMDRMWSIEEVKDCKEDMNHLIEDFDMGVGHAFGKVLSGPQITPEEYRGLVSELLGCIDNMKEGIIGWARESPMSPGANGRA